MVLYGFQAEIRRTPVRPVFCLSSADKQTIAILFNALHRLFLYTVVAAVYA